MSIGTNILRIKMEGHCYQYELLTDGEIKQQDLVELQKFIEGLDVSFIYQHPYIYSLNHFPEDKLEIKLSRGDTMEFFVKLVQSENKSHFLPVICDRLLRSLEFLHSTEINASFNPFEEKRVSPTQTHIPGISLQPMNHPTYLSICIVPVNLCLKELKDISSVKMLLDYQRGNFYQRVNIVRVDKTKNLIHFRNGNIVEMNSLKNVTLQNMNGWDLASQMKNILQRFRLQSEQILRTWQISFESKFLPLSSGLIGSGSIAYRGGMERNLNDIIYPLARNSYNHYFRLHYKDVCFEDNLETQIRVFCPKSVGDYGKALKRQLEKILDVMSLKVKLSFLFFESLSDSDQVLKMLNTQTQNPYNMHMFIVPVEPSKQQKDTIFLLKQRFINTSVYFHFLEIGEDQIEELDIVAFRTLATIYPKYRLHPWKLKMIPFGEKPTVVCTINVQKRIDGQYSVCIVSTLNSFFSKFCCFFVLAKDHLVESAIFDVLRQSLDRFGSVHKIYPFRVFVFRTGIIYNLREQYAAMRNRLTHYYSEINNLRLNTLTYVHLNKSHPLRTYIQTDANSVTPQSIKKTQLLKTIELNGKSYIQLEVDEPMTEIEIIEKENHEGFSQKVMELIVKLCYGSVGKCFGKGRGFFDFPAKLNEYRDFDLEKWKTILADGSLLFL